MWIASRGPVRAGRLPGQPCSRIAGEDGELCLAEELEKEPERYLGKEFVRQHGATLGFLLKLLNSRDRLLVQTHPDKEKAQKYFHSLLGRRRAGMCWIRSRGRMRVSGRDFARGSRKKGSGS